MWTNVPVRVLHASLRMFSKSYSYALYGRHYHAPLQPTKLLQVAPNAISEIPVNKPSVPLVVCSAVKVGNWDQTTRPVEDDVVYRAFEQRFHHGTSWEETEYHKFMEERLDDDSLEWRRYQTMDDVHSRYESLEKMYQTIRKNGFKTQRELESTDELISFGGKLDIQKFLPPEFREITIDISRDGEFLWAAGMHRLCIAKLVDLEKVPVRVRIRHRAWQRYRDAVYMGEESQINHPDIL